MDIGLKIRRNPIFHYIRYDHYDPQKSLHKPIRSAMGRLIHQGDLSFSIRPTGAEIFWSDPNKRFGRYYSPTVITLKRSGDAWPWKAKPYCHSIGLKFLVVGSIPDKINFFFLRIDPNFKYDSQMRKQRHVYKWNSRKMSVRQQNRINVKIGLIRSFPRIPFKYMSLLSPLLSQANFGSILREKI